MKRSILYPALGLLLLSTGVAACGGDGEAAQGASRAGAPGGPGGGGGARGGGGRGPRIAVVETMAVATGSIAREAAVSGMVEPLRSVGVNSQVAGALVAVNVQEGDFVQPGSVLARLDDRELSAQVASAEAAYEVARGTFARSEQLRENQVITAAEYEKDRAAAASAKASLDGLRTRLGYTIIRSPTAGVVTQKQVEAGDVVSSQTRLFTVADISTLVVRAGVSERDVGALQVGQRVEISLDAHPGREFSGRIRRIFPSADPQTRLVPVEVMLEGEAVRAARPGFLARVRFALGQQNGVLLLPASAIVGEAGSEAVFLYANGTVQRHAVETGLTSQGKVQILSGLKEGDVVVSTGNNNLRDGAEVRVVAGPGAEAPKKTADAAPGADGAKP